MKVKSVYPHRISFVISIISLVSLLAFNGCFFWGGEGKEEPKTAETPKEEPVATPATQKGPIDESRFQDGKYDAIQQIKSTGPDGQVVVVGTLNWSNGVVRAKGFGKGTDKFSAITAARTVAEANLLGIIKGVSIDSTTTVENAMLKDQKIVRVIQGVLRGAAVLEEKFDEESQTAVVEVGTGLESVTNAIPGGFSAPEQLPPDAFKPRVSTAFYTFQTIDANHKYIPSDISSLDEVQSILEKVKQQDEIISKLQEELEAFKEAEETKKPEKPYTGIVIDASGLDVKEALYPKIYYRDDDANKLLYGDVSKNRPGEQVDMWAGWAKTLSDTKTDSKVEDNPLIILQDVGVSENGDPVINAEAAKKIESLEKEYHFLEQGKVVIVL